MFNIFEYIILYPILGTFIKGGMLCGSDYPFGFFFYISPVEASKIF